MADSVCDTKNVDAAADEQEVCEISAEKLTIPEKVAAAETVSEVVVTEPEDAEKVKDADDVVEEVAIVVEDGVNETDSCKLKEKPKNGISKNGMDSVAVAAAAAAAAADDDHAENGDSQDDLIHEIKVTDVSGEDNSNDVCSLKRKSLTADAPCEKKLKVADENDHESVVVEVKNGSEKVA